MIPTSGPDAFITGGDRLRTSTGARRAQLGAPELEEVGAPCRIVPIDSRSASASARPSGARSTGSCRRSPGAARRDRDGLRSSRSAPTPLRVGQARASARGHGRRAAPTRWRASGAPASSSSALGRAASSGPRRSVRGPFRSGSARGHAEHAASRRARRRRSLIGERFSAADVYVGAPRYWARTIGAPGFRTSRLQRSVARLAGAAGVPALDATGRQARDGDGRALGAT